MENGDGGASFGLVTSSMIAMAPLLLLGVLLVLVR